MLNHDLVQTVEYWEEGYDEELVLGTINAVRSPLVATLVPDAANYQLGGTLGYDLKLQNWTKNDISAYVRIDAIFPTGGSVRLRLAMLDLAESEVKMIRQDQGIPLTVPTGAYSLRVQVGMPPDDLWSADFFDFTITP